MSDQTALAGSHAAVYGYGTVLAATDDRVNALQRLIAARSRRDHLIAIITAGGETPVGAAPAYTLPFTVNTPLAANAFAGLLEDRCAGQLCAAAGAYVGPDRAWAASAAQDCATWSVRWTGVAPVWAGVR